MKSPDVTWYYHRHIDTAELVDSEFAGRAYHCPTVERLDAHLRTLSEHLGSKSDLTDSAKERTRRDVDQLLERRTFLRLMVGQAGTPRGRGSPCAA